MSTAVADRLMTEQQHLLIRGRLRSEPTPQHNRRHDHPETHIVALLDRGLELRPEPYREIIFPQERGRQSQQQGR